MAVKSLKRSSVKSTQKTNAMLAGYSFQDYELIESVFLASSASSVTFNNINQYATEYKHLHIRWVARAATGDGVGGVSYRTNGQTSNYSMHLIEGDGSTVFSGAAVNTTSGRLANMARANSSTVIFSAGVAEFLDAFSTTKNKTLRSFAGSRVVGTSYVDLGSSMFFGNQDAISSIEIFTISNNLATGSRFSLYGIR
jgi:hypothetical protein